MTYGLYVLKFSYSARAGSSDQFAQGAIDQLELREVLLRVGGVPSDSKRALIDYQESSQRMDPGRAKLMVLYLGG